jgi:predicted ribosomally synthesized peptide with SipW-like signal peptide
MKNLLKIVFLLSSFLILITLPTNSYFSDRASISGNTFQTENWPNWENKLASDSESKSPFMPAMAYGNDRYGIIFYQSKGGNNELYFSLIDEDGNKIGADLRVTNDPGDSFDPSIVWNGNDFGIIWYESWQIYFARISSDGVIIQGKTLIASGVHPSVVWNSATGQYGLTWWGDFDSVPGTKFVRLDTNGNIIGNIITLNSVNDGGYYRPRIASSGNDYGVSWIGNRTGNPEVIFASVDNNGVKKSNDIQLTNSGYQLVWQITWDGNNYTMITVGNLGTALIKVNANGNSIQTHPLTEITAGSNFGITWYKDRYILSFSSDIFSTPGNYRIDIVKAEYDENGKMVSNLKQISTLPGYNYYPSNFVYTGNRLVVSWVSDLWGPNQKIYFAQGVD